MSRQLAQKKLERQKIIMICETHQTETCPVDLKKEDRKKSDLIPYNFSCVILKQKTETKSRQLCKLQLYFEHK